MKTVIISDTQVLHENTCNTIAIWRIVETEATIDGETIHTIAKYWHNPDGSLHHIG